METFTDIPPLVISAVSTLSSVAFTSSSVSSSKWSFLIRLQWARIQWCVIPTIAITPCGLFRIFQARKSNNCPKELVYLGPSLEDAGEGPLDEEENEGHAEEHDGEVEEDGVDGVGVVGAVLLDPPRVEIGVLFLVLKI